MTGYGEAAYRAAADFEQAMARLRQAVLDAARVTPLSAVQIIEQICDTFAITGGWFLSPDVAAVIADTTAAATREHVADEIAQHLRRATTGHTIPIKSAITIANQHAAKPGR